MKYIFFISLFVIIAFLILKSPNNKSLENPLPPNPTPTPTILKKVSNGYFLERGIDAKNMYLVNNSNAGKKMLDLVKEYKCTKGINGGFYTTDNKPLGWMVINNQEISLNKQSTLFNGYINIWGDRSFEISLEQPVNIPLFGLQTGPVLIFEGKVKKLSLIRDKQARRMVMGSASDGIFLLAIFDSEAELSGPRLSELPTKVIEIANKENLAIESAINLDGGSASAFYGSQGILDETNNIGSWWCVR